MSVINSVLKDLESRHSEFTPIEIASVDPVTPVRKNLSKWTLALALVIIVSGLLAITYYQPPPPVAAPVATVVPPHINQMVGLQIRESPSQLSLEFAMHEKAVSYLKERSQNSFVYHLKNIESQIQAPQITDNRWLEQLSINQQAAGVDVTFQTTSRVLVSTEQVQKQDEIIWIITLEKLPDPVAVNTLPDPVIETSKLVQEPPVAVVEDKIAAPVQAASVKAAPVKVEIKSSSNELNETNQLRQAMGSIKSRDWQTAETLLLGLLDGPQDALAREQLLGLYARPGLTKKYAQLTLQSNARYPENSLFANEYARALFQRQEYESVIALLQSQSNPNAKRFALMAASYQRLDQHEKAIEFYQQSLKLNRQDSKSWIGLAISLEHNTQIEAALKSYQVAIKRRNLNQRLTRFAEQRIQTLQRAVN
ncbi:MAG: hypothetical protein GY784_10635 [Gammaproteobacteria bacterium]|nr:hypothetical protein [Gammaproteobacteria bacterium]